MRLCRRASDTVDLPTFIYSAAAKRERNVICNSGQYTGFHLVLAIAAIVSGDWVRPCIARLRLARTSGRVLAKTNPATRLLRISSFAHEADIDLLRSLVGLMVFICPAQRARAPAPVLPPLRPESLNTPAAPSSRIVSVVLALHTGLAHLHLAASDIRKRSSCDTLRALPAPPTVELYVG